MYLFAQDFEWLPPVGISSGIVWRLKSVQNIREKGETGPTESPFWSRTTSNSNDLGLLAEAGALLPFFLKSGVPGYSQEDRQFLGFSMFSRAMPRQDKVKALSYAAVAPAAAKKASLKQFLVIWVIWLTFLKYYIRNIKERSILNFVYNCYSIVIDFRPVTSSDAGSTSEDAGRFEFLVASQNAPQDQCSPRRGCHGGRQRCAPKLRGTGFTRRKRWFLWRWRRRPHHQILSCTPPVADGPKWQLQVKDAKNTGFTFKVHTSTSPKNSPQEHTLFLHWRFFFEFFVVERVGHVAPLQIPPRPLPLGESLANLALWTTLWSWGRGTVVMFGGGKVPTPCAQPMFWQIF